MMSLKTPLWLAIGQLTLGLCDPSCSTFGSKYNKSGSIAIPYPQPPVANTPPGYFDVSIYEFYDEAAGLGNRTIVATNGNNDPSASSDTPTRDAYSLF